MTSDNAAGQATAGRRLRIALIVSLALNVLFVGVVAGSLLWPKHHGWKRQAFKGLSAFSLTLPTERGDEVRQEIEKSRAELAPLRKVERETRDTARDLLLDEPFDVEKFRAAWAIAAEADAKEKSTRFSLFVDMAAKLTPEERRELHAWIERRRARRKRRWAR